MLPHLNGSTVVCAALFTFAMAALACSHPVVALGQRVVVELGEGQRTAVAGTDLIVALTQVRNLTAQGCLGGPVGCPDSAELVVSRGPESQRVALYLPRNTRESEQRVDQARLFGHVIRLVALEGTRARLEVGVAQ